jgi:hypothetical protein
MVAPQRKCSWKLVRRGRNHFRMDIKHAPDLGEMTVEKTVVRKSLMEPPPRTDTGFLP